MFSLEKLLQKSIKKLYCELLITIITMTEFVITSICTSMDISKIEEFRINGPNAIGIIAEKWGSEVASVSSNLDLGEMGEIEKISPDGLTIINLIIARFR